MAETSETLQPVSESESDQALVAGSAEQPEAKDSEAAASGEATVPVGTLANTFSVTIRCRYSITHILLFNNVSEWVRVW